MIAGMVDAPARAEQVIAHMERAIEEVRVQAANRKKKRVYCEEWGKPLITSQPWVAELVEAAGGQFLGEPGRQIPPHDVIENDPEVIIAAWCGRVIGFRLPRSFASAAGPKPPPRATVRFTASPTNF